MLTRCTRAKTAPLPVKIDDPLFVIREESHASEGFPPKQANGLTRIDQNTETAYSNSNDALPTALRGKPNLNGSKINLKLIDFEEPVKVSNSSKDPDAPHGASSSRYAPQDMDQATYRKEDIASVVNDDLNWDAASTLGEIRSPSRIWVTQQHLDSQECLLETEIFPSGTKEQPIVVENLTDNDGEIEQQENEECLDLMQHALLRDTYPTTTGKTAPTIINRHSPGSDSDSRKHIGGAWLDLLLCELGIDAFSNPDSTHIVSKMAELVGQSLDVELEIGSLSPMLIKRRVRYAAGLLPLRKLMIKVQHLRLKLHAIFLAVQHIAKIGIIHNAISIATIRFCINGKPLLADFDEFSYATTKKSPNKDLKCLGLVVLEYMNGVLKKELRNLEEVRRLRAFNKTFGLKNGEKWSGCKLLVDFLDNVFNAHVPAIIKLEKPLAPQMQIGQMLPNEPATGSNAVEEVAQGGTFDAIRGDLDKIIIEVAQASKAAEGLRKDVDAIGGWVYYGPYRRQPCPLPKSPNVHWEKTVVKSVSRKPTRLEYLRMNLLESHADRCTTCEPLLYNRKPAYCRQGCLLEDLVLRDLMLRKDGRIYSTEEECGHLIRVEVPYHYRAVNALLEQVDRFRIRDH
ncbi:hypothetical protein DDE82_008745 [Stemphylium lycopersici]|nr:hypothetical protein DDE82_008745 [Stemphylium lycopersici]